jgi:glycosyltransferase involved in cell wall biosynthesis
MAEAIATLLRDAGFRERLAAVGRERAAGFTWPRAAAETVACYERALAT